MCGQGIFCYIPLITPGGGGEKRKDTGKGIHRKRKEVVTYSREERESIDRLSGKKRKGRRDGDEFLRSGEERKRGKVKQPTSIRSRRRQKERGRGNIAFSLPLKREERERARAVKAIWSHDQGGEEGRGAYGVA